MFRAFKLDAIAIIDQDLYQIGEVILENQKVTIEKSLKNFMYKNNSLDGSAIQANWFPQIDTHVFISHSHKDKDIAIALAGWLWREFKIKSFIDSLIWGYSNELLKEIDDDYCLNESKTFYNYEARNVSTSHVHMMLSTALAMMIDKTECLIFLDTPQSIIPVEGIKKRTESPWLYFEIATTKLLEIKIPSRPLFEQYKNLSKSFDASYEVDFTHFVNINADDLNKWKNLKKFVTAEQALDSLYKLFPPEIQSLNLQI